MFTPADLEARFTHIPTALHQFDEAHKSVIDAVVEAATSILRVIPYGQESEDVVTLLVSAAERAHNAIDAVGHPGTVKVGGQVVESTLPDVTPVPALDETSPSNPDDGNPPPDAPVVASGDAAGVAGDGSGAAPAPAVPTEADKESFLEHIEGEVKDFLHVGEKDVAVAGTVLTDAEAVAGVAVAVDPALKPEVAEGEQVATEAVADATAVVGAVEGTTPA